MNLRKIGRTAKAVHEVATSDNPGAAAGKVVSGALQIAHPLVGTVLKKPVEMATEAIVNKGIEIAKNPEVQAKVKEVASDVGHKAVEVGTAVGHKAVEVGTQAGQRAVEVGGDAARAARRGLNTLADRARAFREGRS